MPMVGILSSLVTNLAELIDKHSKTIENAPAFSIFFASFKSCAISFFVCPSTLNFFYIVAYNQYGPLRVFFFY